MQKLIASKKKHITTEDAAASLKISESQFRRLAEKFNKAPADIEEFHGRGRCYQIRYFWSRKDVAVLKRTKAYKACLVRATQNEAKRAVQRAEFEKRGKEEQARRERHRIYRHRLLREVYPQPSDAIDGACYVMFHLNRKVKHTSMLKSSVYEVKSRLIRYLCSIGAAEAVVEHYQVIESSWAKDDISWHSQQSQLTRSFVCFSFRVNGLAYTWHQPKEKIDWEYEVTAPSKFIPRIEAREYDPLSENPEPALEMIKYAIGELKPLDCLENLSGD